VAEQLFCKQQVTSSTLVAGSMLTQSFDWVVFCLFRVQKPLLRSGQALHLQPKAGFTVSRQLAV